MKNISVFVSELVLAVFLCAVVFCLSGCRYGVKAADFLDDTITNVTMLGSGEEFSLPGETEAEARRRRDRVKRINRQELMADIDSVMLMDRPSKLTDKRIP